MALISDQAGNLHLFYPHRPDESSSMGIDYSRWNGLEWSRPVNVLVNPDGSDVAHVRAVVDDEHVIHLIWGASTNVLYYAFALAALADSPRAWSRPQAIATALTDAAIVTGPDGSLYVAFADPNLSSVSLLSSSDRGMSWPSYSVVTSTPAGTAPGEVGLAMDGAGRIHVTWTEHTLPDGYPLRGVFYARSIDGGQTWEPPIQVDDAYHGEIGVAAVGADQIHLVWRSNVGGDGTFHQWSPDGGASWSLPDRRDDRGGISGMPSFVVDSAQALHYVIGPVLVATWSDGTLGPYLDIVSHELRTGIYQGEGWTEPERAVIAITTGNHLHVVFETGFQRLWYVTSLVDAPRVAPQALPTSTPALTPAATREQTSASAGPTVATTDLALPGASSTTSGAFPPLVVGVAVPVVLVLIVVAWKIRGRRS